ncbi:MAG: electron transfer flavoprotein subunit alpha/FixB family protein [Desulfamplus sp.]|nr:electron transfer flavoprotein subunit alpha/FixB family protein [Desulfamplus sp.]
MKSGENFKILNECANSIENFSISSTAVGASRVAVDLGWVPYRMQVGQTGEKVSPKVYIACGISGSIQHFAGMKMSGMIIAINENINAAIMSNCDYFVEADLFEIVPQLTKELQKERQKS